MIVYIGIRGSLLCSQRTGKGNQHETDWYLDMPEKTGLQTLNIYKPFFFGPFTSTCVPRSTSFSLQHGS